MSTEDGSTNALPEELERALRRATDRTLSALTSLRRAVRQHVRTERDRGTTLSGIEFDLRAIIARAQEGISQTDGDGGDGHHDGSDGGDGHHDGSDGGDGHHDGSDGGDGHHDALTAQVIKWSEGFYKGN